MTTVAVCYELEDDWSLSAEDPFSCVLYGLLDRNDIHTIGLSSAGFWSDLVMNPGPKASTNLDTRDLVSTSEVFGVGGAALR